MRLRNLEWMFTQAQYPNGLFHPIHHDGLPFTDGFETPGTETWLMVRKQADALYFLVKTFMLLQGQDAKWRLPAHWETGTRRLADLFVRTFQRCGPTGAIPGSRYWRRGGRRVHGFGHGARSPGPGGAVFQAG